MIGWNQEWGSPVLRQRRISLWLRARYGPRKGQSLRLSFLFLKKLLIPTQIILSSATELSIKWDDLHSSVISLRTLRDECPCAGCRGETVLLKTYKPRKQPDLPGKYSLKSIQQVGHYAIQISWGDGHSTGIYTWEQLRNLCECRICLTKRTE